jgi:hypothetical protein
MKKIVITHPGDLDKKFRKQEKERKEQIWRVGGVFVSWVCFVHHLG